MYHTQWVFVQNVTKLNANSTSAKLHVLAKRKAHDQQSEIKKKCLKGNIGFTSRKCVNKLICDQNTKEGESIILNFNISERNSPILIDVHIDC